MSTRSLIAIQNKDKTFTASYCHSDGYLSHNGHILFSQYSDESRVSELISWGDMSILGPVIIPDPTKGHSFDGPRQDGVCVFYGRDRGEKDTGPRVHKTAKDAYAWGMDSWAEYVYVYRNGAWHLARPDKTGRIRYIKLTERNTQETQK